jgi:hypothetical protein
MDFNTSVQTRAPSRSSTPAPPGANFPWAIGDSEQIPARRLQAGEHARTALTKTHTALHAIFRGDTVPLQRCRRTDSWSTQTLAIDGHNAGEAHAPLVTTPGGPAVSRPGADGDGGKPENSAEVLGAVGYPGSPDGY